jgi:hypothetical protein
LIFTFFLAFSGNHRYNTLNRGFSTLALHRVLSRSGWAVCSPGRENKKEQQMDLQGIREALLRQPFEPFSIRLADGRSLAVPHPEMVAVGKRRVIVVEPDDSWSVVEPLLIVSLDYDGKHRPRTNQRKK